MKQNESIKAVTTNDLKTIDLTTKLSEVRSLFAELNIHHLPVVEGKRLIGMLSYNDFLRIDAKDLYDQNKKQADVMLDSLSSVKEVMTKNLVTVAPTATIKEATEILSSGSFHSLPVVDENEELAGLVTSTDLLKFFYEQY